MNFKNILSRMTLEQKISLCSGKGFWDTKDFKELGIPSISLNDGPHGLRKQNNAADHLGINDSVPATCFPTASSTACSWDEKLLFQIGQAIAEECLQEGTQVVLGPGANMKRNPLCGRNFEYFSEDPLLAGKLAAAWIRGVESKGVSSSLKHFAANNTENQRMSSDSVIDERALREIYLKAFEIAVKEGKPSTVMCAYNKINGTYCSDNKMLLTDILRDEWGFKGAVVTDWGAMNDRVEAFKAGIELEMPGSKDFFNRTVMEAVESGRLSEQDIDSCVERLLELIFRTVEGATQNYHYDVEAHHALARRSAAESAVLLKNVEQILPLNPEVPITLIGALAKKPRYQGAGSSRICPTKLTSIMESLDESKLKYRFYEGYSLTDGEDLRLVDEAVKGVKQGDIVVIVAGLPDEYESEGFDRNNLEMPRSHNKLIEEVSKVNPNVVVILVGGAPVTMPWIDRVKAVLNMYLSGQAGGDAAVDLLTGVINPSGKLAETYPMRYEDVPSSEIYTETPKRQLYEESIYIGYRYYESAKVKSLFPFGFGLSYTTFEYSDLKISSEVIKKDIPFKITVNVKNAGQNDGAEIVQIYVKSNSDTVFHPEKELKAFQKVFLKTGEKKQLEFTLDSAAFSYYDTDKKAWISESGFYDICIAAASNDVRFSVKVRLDGDLDLPNKAKMPEWYFKPKGKPSHKDFEDLIIRKLPLYQKAKKALIQWNVLFMT